MNIETITLPEHPDRPHIVGDVDCFEGWCSGEEGAFPTKCVCGGLIHAAFGDEDSDCNYWLYKQCDRCGDEYSYVD